MKKTIYMIHHRKFVNALLNNSSMKYHQARLYMIHHRKFVNALLNNSSMKYHQARLCWDHPFELQCSNSTFTKARQSILLVQKDDNKTNYHHLSAFINKFKKMNPDLVVALQLDDKK